MGYLSFIKIVLFIYLFNSFLNNEIFIFVVKLNNNFLLIAVFSLIILIVYLGRDFLQIFTISGFIAFYIFPLKNKLKKKLNNEVIVSLILLFLGILLMLIILLIIVSLLVSGYSNFNKFISNSTESEMILRISNFVDSFDFTSSLTETGLSSINEFIQNLIMLIPGLLLNSVVFVFILFYFIRYGEIIIEFIKSLIPISEKSDFNKLLSRINLMMNGLVKGQLLSAILQAFSMFIFYTLLKFPFSFEVSIIAFIIIFLGFYSSIVPILMVIYYLYQGFVSGNYNFFLYNIIFALFVTSIDNVIKPIIGKTAGKFNMLLFIIGTMGGLLTLGYTGFLLGPLIIGLFQITFEIYFKEKKVKL